MRIDVTAVPYESLGPLRNRLLGGVACQLVRYSILRRGLAAGYLVRCDGEAAGYGGIWREHFPGRVMEFEVAPSFSHLREDLFESFVGATATTSIEAQSNRPEMFALLEAFGSDPTVENLLFEDGPERPRPADGVLLRRREPEDRGPDGDWVMERDGEVVGAGGILTHYNPPFGDLYMEVAPARRREGLGAMLVQELRRVSGEMGLVPAARCDADNVASRRTLLRGGMAECGRLVSARLRGPGASDPTAPTSRSRSARRAPDPSR